MPQSLHRRTAHQSTQSNAPTKGRGARCERRRMPVGSVTSCVLSLPPRCSCAASAYWQHYRLQWTHQPHSQPLSSPRCVPGWLRVSRHAKYGSEISAAHKLGKNFKLSQKLHLRRNKTHTPHHPTRLPVRVRTLPPTSTKTASVHPSPCLLS
jgi:hypothetical protein